MKSTPHNYAIRGRAIQLLAALEQAGATPITSNDFQAFAYLANVLSPVWEVEPLEGSILKDEHGPFSAVLQGQLDACIGAGLVVVASLNAVIAGNKTKLTATYRLDSKKARPILDVIRALPDEMKVAEFLAELAFAFVEIAPDRRDDAAIADAAWSNPSIAKDRVVDFAEFVSATRQNPSWNTAQAFQRYLPKGVTLNKAEKIAMYMRLLKRRAHG